MGAVLTLETVLLSLTCAAAALAAAMFLAPRRAPQAGPAMTPGEPDGPILLFDGTELADTSSDLRNLLGPDRGGTGVAPDWQDLRGRLEATYPDMPQTPGALCDNERRLIRARGGLVAGDIMMERIGEITRLCLASDSLAPANGPANRESELQALRLAMDATPYPVWRVDAQGRVVWHNAAYGVLARKLRGKDARLAQPLFPDDATALPPGRRTRISVAADGQDQKLWFDVTVAAQPAGNLYFAADINAVVDAEIAQRNFVQTLAKTFAQLPIGLAIFDRNRQLALFNPALVDLTALPADFLSARPALSSFFDRLRDRRMMPEPKNYNGWRQQMADLVAAAADGRYQETWSLPSGSVYSVSGRPHPDGAVAFLIEDITAEITLTRQFRAELELGQAILDSVEDAIAVFSSDGTLVFSNEPFHALWGLDPDRGFAQMTIVDATRAWQDLSVPTPVWGELRDFVAARENRATWSAETRLRSGERLDCAIRPIQGGATMVRFRRLAGWRDSQPHAQPEPARPV
ncbi:MAG: PAS-domain containing protein [Jhaorihella sp.]